MAGSRERLRLPPAMNAKCAHLHGQCRTTPRLVSSVGRSSSFWPICEASRWLVALATRPDGRQQESQSEEVLAALRANRQINGNLRCIFSELLGS